MGSVRGYKSADGNKYGNGTTVARVYKQYPKWKASIDKEGRPYESSTNSPNNPDTPSNDPNDANIYVVMGWVGFLVMR